MSKQSLPFQHCLNVRVYYEDTDAAGVVYYANYLKFAERGRTEMLRKFGVNHAKILSESGVAFAVRRCNIDYKSAARLDDELSVLTWVTHIGGASVGMEQAIVRGERLLTTLELTLVCMSPTGQAVRIPPEVRKALKQVSGDSDSERRK